MSWRCRSCCWRLAWRSTFFGGRWHLAGRGGRARLRCASRQPGLRQVFGGDWLLLPAVCAAAGRVGLLEHLGYAHLSWAGHAGLWAGRCCCAWGGLSWQVVLRTLVFGVGLGIASLSCSTSSSTSAFARRPAASCPMSCLPRACCST